MIKVRHDKNANAAHCAFNADELNYNQSAHGYKIIVEKI